MKLFLMLPAICLMLALQSEKASAADGSVLVQGVNILSAANHTVQCGNGTATYDTAAKTLTLNGVSVTGNSGSYGLEIHEPGVTIDIIGENTVSAHYGIWSDYPLTVRGTNGGRLSVNTAPSPSLPKFACAGIHVRSGGLTVKDMDLQLSIGKMSDAGAYAIESWGGDNLISNSKIKITMNSLADSDKKCIGINMPGADSLAVVNNSSITMESLDTGISFSGNLKISGSSLTIRESAMHGVISGKTEIAGGSVLNITSQDGQALSAAGNKVTVSGSSVNLESTGTNGIFCQDLEILDSSDLSVKGYWPALYVDNTTVIQDSSVDTVTANDVGIYCKGSTNISGSEVSSVSKVDKSGIRVLGDLTIKDSDITSSGNAGSESIFAKGSISITGGTTEIGNGKISSEKDIYIGGIISSNGVPSYDNIADDTDVTFAEADYSAVDESVRKSEALNRNDYTNFEIVDEAVNAIVRGKPFWEQEVVDGYAAAIEAALSALTPVSPAGQITYEITEGANQTITKGEDNSITIKSNGDFDKFVSIMIDDTEIAKEHYTATSGSTVITLKPEYVRTLAAGTYTVKINYTDGLARTILTIQEDEPDDKPLDKPDADDNSADGSDNGTTSKSQDTKDTKDTKNTIKKAPQTGDDLPVMWLSALIFSYVVIRILRKSGQHI